ncbi:MAG: amidohydrolase family protein [Dissulfuribacterales bacterium]
MEVEKVLKRKLPRIGGCFATALDGCFGACDAALHELYNNDSENTGILFQEEDMKKIVDLDIGITLQPSFLISPLEPVSYLEEILGDRVKKGSPIKSLLNAGIHVSGGSDAPVTYPDPIEGIYGACNHPYDPDESVSIIDALKMYTCEVARTTFDEKDRGSLEKGKIADMVILNQDPLSMNPEDLRSLRVEKLFLGGKQYQSGMGIMGMLWNGLAGRKEKI